MPTRPGSAVWPAKSNDFAEAGIDVVELGPTAVMRPDSIIIVWSSLGAPPVPSITRTCVSATIGSLTLMKSATPWGLHETNSRTRVTRAELEQSDAYEPAGYKRVLVQSR